MPSVDYIPARDADFAAWLLNFSTLITATPTAYGLTAPDATAIAAQNTIWQAALTVATDPSTRTPPAVAAKDAARVTAVAVVRPYAQRVKANPSVTNEQRSDLGLTIDSFPPTPIPQPTTAPVMVLISATPLVHQLRYYDSTTPTTKAKPYGVIGLEVRRAIGIAPAVDPSAAPYLGQWGKSPNLSVFSPGDPGKIATYFARWVTRSGPGGVQQSGPWSTPLSVTVI